MNILKRILPTLVLIISIISHNAYSQNKKVLIIGIDGTRANALTFANTPNIDVLINNGLYSPDALNSDITWSGPAWSAILTGVWSTKHGVTDNGFRGSDFTNYPSVFKRIYDFNSSLTTASICHWGPININIVQGDADYKLTVTSDADVTSNAVDYLTNNNPDLLFLHFDDVDAVGHASGFSTSNSNYISAIEDVDTLIAPIITAINNRTNIANEDWLILLTSDHGGTGNSHGGNSISEKNVFFIASGDNVPQSVINKGTKPVNCLNETTKLDFDGSNDYVQVPAAANLNFGTSQNFTIECRVKTSVNGDVAIVGNKDWDTGLNKGFMFSFKYGEWKVNIGDGSNRVDAENLGIIDDNEWHTLSASFNRASQKLNAYIDGAPVAVDVDISTIGDITTNQGLFFGSDINGAYSYNGAIAEVRVWNTDISASGIATWSCNSIDNTHANYANLIGYWKINEGTGTIITDSSSSVNDGTNNGASWLIEDGDGTMDDYSNTPRIVDIAATTLSHLCIPIDANWNLDGKTLITPVCSPLSTETHTLNSKIVLYPNPAYNQLHIISDNILFDQPISLKIYNSQSSKIYDTILYKKNTTLNISNYASGLYFIIISTDKGTFTKMIIKN